ncbi:hypothetical protein KI387_017953, partial [Taxus chinensis]
MSSMAPPPPPPLPPPQGPNPPPSSSPSPAAHLHPHHHPLPHHHPHHHAMSASSLSLGLVPHNASATRLSNPEPLASEPPPPPAAASPTPTSALLSRIKLADLLPDDGAPTPLYCKAVEALSGSLMRHNAAVIELGADDSTLLRVALESAKFYFRTRAQVQPNWAAKSPGYAPSAPSRPNMYSYRAGRAIEEGDSSPPCMADVFRCLGKASRAALSAIARHLRLRSDVFNPLLDDLPLPANEVSSSALVATYMPPSSQNGKGLFGGPKTNIEIEKGLMMLIVSDSPGLQVCDPNNRWYLADNGSRPGDVLLLTGRALSHATAGLRHAASYRIISDLPPGSGTGGRTSLAFRLMPQNNAILDCSPISEAGHIIPQSYGPISVSQFMDDLMAEEAGMSTGSDNTLETRRNQNQEPSLRSVLSDPLSGAYLEDAFVARCGHSFGGAMLRKVYETSRCITCGTEFEVASLVPNHALRAAATAVKNGDERRQLYNAALRKRRKEGDQGDGMKRLLTKDDVGFFMDRDSSRQSKGVQYPFAVDEKVMIKGNKRTPRQICWEGGNCDCSMPEWL